MGIGSIASTTSKRKGYADRSLNSSFQDNDKQEMPSYQHRRSSVMKDTSQFSKYSNSVILQPNKSGDHSYEQR